MAGTCKYSNEHSDCVKGGEILDYLKAVQFLKKDSAPWSK